MKNWNIQQRFLLIGMLPGLLISLVLGVYFISQRFHDLNDLLDQRALAMAKQLAPVCEYGVTIGNSAILQNIANNMLEEPDVRSVSIYNQDMQLLAHSGPRMLTDQQSSAQMQRGQMHLIRTSGSVRIRAPILAQNLLISDQVSNQFFAEQSPAPRLLGWAELELSATNTELTRYQHIASSLSLIVVTLIVGLLIAIRLGRQFSGPSNNILQALKSLMEGKYETRVQVEASGELREMATSLNTLAAGLQRTISEQQRNLEEATRDMQETMDDLEIRNRQLLLDQREAKEASRMKSEFLANVSHELRTPLNSISGFVDRMKQTELSERQQDWIDIVSKATRDLVGIINDILDLSKLEAGKLIITHAPFNLRDVVEDVLELIAPNGMRKGLEISLAIAPEVPVCLSGDSMRLKQVLTNLVGNAVKFTDQGSVHLSISLINSRDNQASLLFEIQDTGVGLSLEQQQKLFNAFTQADNSTARKFGGSGLGLIISRALVEAMHGDIKVESSPGEGSTFSFHITVDIDKQHRHALPALSPGCLALLDDREHSLLNIHQLLTSWGLESIDCRSADALESLIADDSIKLDAIIMAVQSSYIGTEKCHSLGTRLVPQGIPIVALVDSEDEEDRQRLLEYGAVSCLSRPLNSRKLHRLLDKLLNGEALNEPENRDKAVVTSQNTLPPTILVVDDNEANLKLVLILLEDLGLPVIPASSGPQAIEAIQQHAIDLVFMDIQMPGMTGLEATEAIRQLPGKQSLPIIALTAHAMADERQYLIKKGMNDYQTKPISLQQLIDTIYQWTGYRASAQPYLERENIPPAAAIVTTNSQPAAEYTVFSVAAALQAASQKPALANEMMSLLLKNLPADLESIRDCWEEEDLTHLQAAVHRLHGATRYCGVPQLQHALNELETALKSGNSASLPELMRMTMTAGSRLQQWSEDNDWQALIQNQTSAVND
ncbi:response regulator [Oceanobacter mangrovi]|uniref:response regulator n=1 Tax=Oceanobacter mangrovi TaxID=2862510 RepID=UPI001C8DEB42|nr:response regulator [Oceanobacter mangrovi]